MGRIANYAKAAFGLCVAGLAGFAIGVITVGSMAEPTATQAALAGAGSQPEWVASAKTLQTVSVAGMAVAMVGWMYVDYRYCGGEGDG